MTKVARKQEILRVLRENCLGKQRSHSIVLSPVARGCRGTTNDLTVSDHVSLASAFLNKFKPPRKLYCDDSVTSVQ